MSSSTSLQSLIFLGVLLAANAFRHAVKETPEIAHLTNADTDQENNTAIKQIQMHAQSQQALANSVSRSSSTSEHSLNGGSDVSASVSQDALADFEDAEEEHR